MTLRTIVFALAATLAAGTAPALAQAVGTSSAVRGDVFVTSSGSQRRAQVSQEIRLADRVATKDASALQVLLLDATTFTVAQNADVTIDRFVYDPDRSTGEVAASVTKGAFRFVSGRIGRANPNGSSISTPSATIGIRGTMVEGVVGEDAVALAQLAGVSTAGANAGASILILRGPGARRNTIDRRGVIDVASGGGSVSVTRANYAVFVPRSGEAPRGPFRITPDMQNYLDFFLRSDPSGPPVEPTVIERSADLAGQTKFQAPIDVPAGPGIDVIDDAQDGVFDPDSTP